MKQLRSVLTAFCFGLFGVGGLIIGTVVFPLVVLIFPLRKQRLVLADIIHYSWIFFVKVMTALRLIVLEKQPDLKALRGTVVVANHPTLLDIVLLISMIPRSVCVVKGALARNFFIRHIIRRLYLTNDGDLARFLQSAQTCLADGLNVIIFPEGTRTNFAQKTPRLFRGFAHLAVRTKSPILPIKIKCTPQILGKNQKWFDVGSQTVTFTVRPRPMIKVPRSGGRTEHALVKKIAEQTADELFEKNN